MSPRGAARIASHRSRCVTVATLAALVLSAGAAASDDGSDRGSTPATPAASRWLTLGVLTGATRFDPHLADYQWNVSPRAAWGAQAIAGIGRFGAGLRVWRSQTTQHIDLADDENPAVRATSLELLGRARLLSRWGTDLEAGATTGWLHLGYAPDHVTIAGSGGGPPIDVALKSVDEWVAGGGLALRHPLIGPWAASVELDSQVFGMTTAHRSGSAIVMGRERFDDWSARLELARVYGRR